ncbi:MAG: hypothetical protein KC620_09705, partial [Myxococcales bacterium]|nr:hypothetical protein [Myxococcales bacterium]
MFLTTALLLGGGAYFASRGLARRAKDAYRRQRQAASATVEDAAPQAAADASAPGPPEVGLARSEASTQRYLAVSGAALGLNTVGAALYP